MREWNHEVKNNKMTVKDHRRRLVSARRSGPADRNNSVVVAVMELCLPNSLTHPDTIY